MIERRELDLSVNSHFIGCWQSEDTSYCDDVISFFEGNKDLQSAGEGPKEWPSDVSQIALCSPSLTPIQPDLFWRGNLDDLPKLI